MYACMYVFIYLFIYSQWHHQHIYDFKPDKIISVTKHVYNRRG